MMTMTAKATIAFTTSLIEKSTGAKIPKLPDAVLVLLER